MVNKDSIQSVISTMHSLKPPNTNLTKVLFIYLTLFVLSTAKIFTQSFSLSHFRKHRGWNFIGRATAHPAKMTLKVFIAVKSKQLRPQAKFDIEIVAVPSQFWQEQIDKKCDISRYEQQVLQNKIEKEISLRVNLSKQTSPYEITREIDIYEPISYNFLVRDCSQTFLKEGLGKHSSLDVVLQVINNEQHFEQNQFHNLWTLPLFAVLNYFVVYFLKKQKDPQGDTWTQYILKISLRSGIFSLVFKYSDYLIYAYANGKHHNLLQILYLLLHSFSDTCIIFIVLFVSFGWTISFIQHKKFYIWIPLSLIISFVHIVVTAFNKSRDGMHDKYHIFDTFAGYIMIGFRVIFYLIFLAGIVRSYLQLSSKHNKLRLFYLRFFLFGTAYLTFLPIGMYLVQSIEQEKRHEYMALGLETSRLILNVWLTCLIGKNSSTYKQIASYSIMDNSQKYF